MARPKRKPDPRQKDGPSREVAATIVKSLEQIAAERARRGATMGQASRATNACHRAVAEKITDWVESVKDPSRTDILLLTKVYQAFTLGVVELDERLKTPAAQPGDGAKVIDAEPIEEAWDMDLSAFAKPCAGNG